MAEEPPPLYKPELIEPKKRLTLLQHCYKEPWVPIGCITTVSVLCVGFGAFINGNKVLAQHMMRARVAAQGATVVIMIVAAGGTLLPKRGEDGSIVRS
ncbi:hypothetical protein AB1Y20_001218 [Prymnesium parvum]|uniref:HIG1 domain-containing protein n=1 Tax=Prymnesium parvum TaxID=97485 RepID=A0AB34KAZ7_PRYPA